MTLNMDLEVYGKTSLTRAEPGRDLKSYSSAQEEEEKEDDEEEDGDD
jgi:hypothetical protein